MLRAKAGADDHIVEHGQLVQRFHDLVRTRQPMPGNFLRRPSGNVVIVKDYAALVGLHDSVHQVEQRCFAGAIRSNQADDFALPDREADIIEREQPSEFLTHSAHFEQRAHSSTLRALGSKR